MEHVTHVVRNGSEWRIAVDLHNASGVPALMVRAKAVGGKSGDPIAPAFYDDNYIALMPGERRTLKVTLDNADTRGEQPAIKVEGFNLARP